MEFRIVWNDSSSAKYADLQSFLNRIAAEAQNCNKNEFAIIICEE